MGGVVTSEEVGATFNRTILELKLNATLERVARLQRQVAQLPPIKTDPANYKSSSSGFIAEIDRMQLEVREYLTHVTRTGLKVGRNQSPQLELRSPPTRTRQSSRVSLNPRRRVFQLQTRTSVRRSLRNMNISVYFQ